MTLPVWLHELTPPDAEGAKAYTTLRGPGATADDPYSGFSLCTYTGDTAAHTDACRAMLAEALSIRADHIIIPRQTHSAHCLTIDSGGDLPSEETLYGVDALVTSQPGIAIGIQTADCLPLAAIDRRHGVVGVAHAGWRGAVGGVVQQMISRMLEAGASAADIEAYTGPCIGRCCFEVGPEVASQFPEKYVSLTDTTTGKAHVDLAGFVAGVLRSLGVPDGSIHLWADGCTRCGSPSLYYSARRLGINSGRHLTLAVNR